MTPEDSLKRMVKHYPGGIEVIAMRIGKPAETLRKELACAPGFKLGLSCATLISELCIEAKSEHCMAFVNALASKAGGFIELPVIDMAEPVNLQRSMGQVIREMSDVSMSTIEGDADGVFSDNDLAKSLKEIHEAYAALQAHELSLRAKNLAGKPSALRAAA